MIDKDGCGVSLYRRRQRVLVVVLTAGWLATSAFTASAGPAAAQTLAQEAALKHAMGDVASAENLYAQAMQEAPNDVGISMALAELYITQQRFDGARSLIDAALQSSPTDYRPWKTQAVYLRAQGDEAGTIRALERAFSLGAKDDRYVVVNLQQHFEATGNKARKQQMDNLIQSLDLQEKR